MWFVDEVILQVRAGDGGNGCVSFRREAHVPRGGPDGGDGGRGGNVVFVVDPQLGTLLDLYYVPHQRAPNGRPGSGAQCSGRAGEDKVIRVPPGTVVVDDERGTVLADLVEPGLRWVAAKGGNGGWGNQHFATPTRQAPDFARPGLAGEQFKLRLQLKLIADVGLVGLPNAGKSTLIARISAARPKIAEYPFTTLTPNLGVVKVDEALSFAVADIPGLIEGSSQGAGLGHRFLRHVERVGLLVHLVEASPLVERDPAVDYQTVRRELAAYSDRLEEIEEVVVLSKRDLDPGGVLTEHLATAVRDTGRAFFAISAVTGEGVRELVNHLGTRVAAKRAANTLQSAAELDDESERVDRVAPVADGDRVDEAVRVDDGDEDSDGDGEP